jgi:hypothetical protein
VGTGVRHPRLVIASLLIGSLVFGGVDQYVGSFPTLSWGTSASLLSAPWLLIAFLGGWTQRTARAGVLMGLGCTYCALLGYAAMTLSPVEGVDLSWRLIAGFCRSEAPVLVAGLATGPLFGWFGHRWHVARAWLGAVLIAAAFCFEPLVVGALRPWMIRSALVRRVEVVIGIVMLGYVAFAMVRGRRRPAG